MPSRCGWPTLAADIPADRRALRDRVRSCPSSPTISPAIAASRFNEDGLFRHYPELDAA